MKAVIQLDVPDWQIGQDVSVYFPDTMLKHGKCEMMKEQEIVRCKDCKFQVDAGRRYPECDKHFLLAKDNWFCADGKKA